MIQESRRLGASWIRSSVTTQIAAAVVVGVLFGCAVRAGDWLTSTDDWFFEIGAPWLAVAWVLGATTSSVSRGAVMGALALVCAVVSYYTMLQIIEYQDVTYLRSYQLDALRRDLSRDITGVWIVVAVAGGSTFGAVGAAWRTAPRLLRIMCVALLGGVLLGEGLAVVVFRGWQAIEVLVAGAAVALLLPWLLVAGTRNRVLTLLATVVAATTAAIAWLVLVETLNRLPL